MVVPLGPGKFYGRSLPRPRLYTDIKLNSERIDPPSPVLDPLISWADEAHWSMGGRCRTRLRLQGRIEGNVTKLRKQMEKKETDKKRSKILDDLDFDEREVKVQILGSDLSDLSDSSPPPAPVATKKRKRMMTTTLLVDEDEGEEEDENLRGFDVGVMEERGSEVRVKKGRRLVRKLKDDFDRVAARESANEGGDGGEKGSVSSPNGKRSSPRLMKK